MLKAVVFIWISKTKIKVNEGLKLNLEFPDPCSSLHYSDEAGMISKKKQILLYAFESSCGHFIFMLSWKPNATGSVMIPFLLALFYGCIVPVR